MFGYLMTKRDQLKVMDDEFYKSIYCGLCYHLRKDYGLHTSLFLTYDLTFLTCLFSSLYESPYEKKVHFCPKHPIRPENMRINDWTAYGAALTILLSYHNLLDDYEDEKSWKSLAMAMSLSKAYEEVGKTYKKEKEMVVSYMEETKKIEKMGTDNLDQVSYPTGHMLGSIFSIRKDEFQKDLYEMGFYLGKFIYFMDAYEDVEEDIKNQNFNPLKNRYRKDEKFEETIWLILNDTAARAVRAFERLPILRNGELLRNILYSGMWEKYRRTRAKRDERKKV